MCFCISLWVCHPLHLAFAQRLTRLTGACSLKRGLYTKCGVTPCNTRKCPWLPCTSSKLLQLHLLLKSYPVLWYLFIYILWFYEVLFNHMDHHWSPSRPWSQYQHRLISSKNSKLTNAEMNNGSLQVQCKCKSLIFWVIFLVAKCIWLIFGAVLSILTRNVMKEYNESRSIAYAVSLLSCHFPSLLFYHNKKIYNIVALALVATPLVAVLEKVPSGVLIIEVTVILLAFTFTVVVLFFENWLGIYH